MYQHILLAVALQRCERYSPHALAAREAAVALAKGSGARLSVLSVYSYDYEMPAEVSLPPEDLGRYRDSHMRQIDMQMETKMREFLSGLAAMDIAITPVLKEGDPRQVIITTAEALGVDLLVIGAHSKRSFLDVLLGGTAAAVSRRAPCALVMVQPGEQPPILQTSDVGEALQSLGQAQPA
jgi:nucleotide-binding universal stress UspA family protein